MSSANDRFREIFRESGLSQDKFADAIHRSRGEIANIIYDKVPPKIEILRAVCDRFSVMEEWLVNGTGPKRRSKTDVEEISELVENAMHGSNDLKKAVIKMICSRSDEELKVLASALSDVYSEIAKEKERQEKPLTLPKVAARGAVDPDILNNVNTDIPLPDMESDIIP